MTLCIVAKNCLKERIGNQLPGAKSLFFGVAAIFLLPVSPLRPPRRPFFPYFCPLVQCPSCPQTWHGPARIRQSLERRRSIPVSMHATSTAWLTRGLCWWHENSVQNGSHRGCSIVWRLVERQNHSNAWQPKLLSPLSLVPVRSATCPHACRVQRFCSHPMVLQLYRPTDSPWPALGTAIIMVNHITPAGQRCSYLSSFMA